MNIPKKLEEKRDELWEKYKERNPPKGQAQLYYKDNQEYWKDGFKEACNLLLPEIEKLEKALFRLTVRLDESASIHDIKPSADIVRQALQSLREFWGESE